MAKAIFKVFLLCLLAALSKEPKGKFINKNIKLAIKICKGNIEPIYYSV